MMNKKLRGQIDHVMDKLRDGTCALFFTECAGLTSIFADDPKRMAKVLEMLPDSFLGIFNKHADRSVIEENLPNNVMVI